MNTQKFKIEIPKPCHEDWNKMTPDAKGAFCASCAKSVHDFTNKTEDQIADVFMKNKDQKICGRFNASQVNKPMEIKVPLNQLPRNVSPVRAFAMAIFLVFGTMLFSCQTSNGQVMGDVAIETTPIQNTVKGETKITGDTVMVSEKMPVMGKPKFIPQDTVRKVSKCTKVQNPEPKMMGEMIWIPIDTVKQIAPPVLPVDTVKDEPLMGKVQFVPQVIEPKNIKITVIDTASNNKQVVIPEVKIAEMVVYPNPSNGEINIRYTVVENTSTSIELFDLNGKKVKTLFTSTKLYAGIYTTTFDISDLPNGNYFCLLKSGEKTSSVKLTVAK